MKSYFFLGAALAAWSAPFAVAQVTPQPTPDISNKALITHAPPNLAGVKSSEGAMLHKLANEFYDWRNRGISGPEQRRRTPHLG